MRGDMDENCTKLVQTKASWMMNGSKRRDVDDLNKNKWNYLTFSLII